jgi:hypothetical protein
MTWGIRDTQRHEGLDRYIPRWVGVGTERDLYGYITGGGGGAELIALFIGRLATGCGGLLGVLSTSQHAKNRVSDPCPALLYRNLNECQ